MDLKNGITGLHTKKSLALIDQETVFSLITGDEDPINLKGKQAENIHNILVDLGIRSEFKTFKGMRHEPFNEIGREAVYKYTLDFFNSI